MKKHLKIVMAQLNLTVGDIHGNLQKHRDAIQEAKDKYQADVVVFPELSLTGYPPEDLLFRRAFVAEANLALQKLAEECSNLYLVVGHPFYKANRLRNGASVLYQGKIISTYAKERLPNYSVFDEMRYFTPGKKSCVVNIHGLPVGILICEDLWSPLPMQRVVEKGAKLVIAINASPFVATKHERRRKMLTQRATENQVPVLYVCNVGGQDELVFDGDSMAIDANGALCASAGLFKEGLFPIEINIEDDKARLHNQHPIAPEKSQLIERVYNALVLATRDYVNKNHISGVLIGISGGIDSALTLAIAVDALGKDRVRGIMMPSRYTSELSMQEAKAVMQNVGLEAEIISIEPAYAAFLSSLQPHFANKKPDVTEENIQARARAVILMALSNKSGFMVLSTGNRSEIAVGYCTIYGDMAGGFNVLRDVYKTLVYKLARYRNTISPVIPQATITRPPSAELAPDQKDEDSLPPYSVLDKILEAYMDLGQSIDEIVVQGFERETVMKVVKMVRQNEYKRKQGAVGPRIHRNSFGKAWRYPITNGFKG